MTFISIIEVSLIKDYCYNSKGRSNIVAQDRGNLISQIGSNLSTLKGFDLVVDIN